MINIPILRYYETFYKIVVGEELGVIIKALWSRKIILPN